MGASRRQGSARGVRWTRAQYESFCRKSGIVPAPTWEPKKLFAAAKELRSKLKGKTKTEAEFEVWLKYRHPSLTVLYEPLKLKIDATCVYIPDFFIPETLTFYEVKGKHLWEDSVIKFKAARAIHTWAKFVMMQKWQGSWRQIRKLPGEGLEAC